LIEKGLKENVPPEFLAEAGARERAAKMARPVTGRMRRMIEREVYRLLGEGKSEEEILRQLASKYGFRTRSRRTEG
jgi:chromosome condensin MukBEF ATPase and DNA-binding subunit MukB